MKTKNIYILYTNIFCYHDLSPKCLGDFLLRKTRKNAFFAIFAHEMGSQLLKNNVFGLTASNYPYFEPSHTSLALQGEKCWPETFLGYPVPTPSPYFFFWQYLHVYNGQKWQFPFFWTSNQKIRGWWRGDDSEIVRQLDSESVRYWVSIWWVS